VPFHLLGDRGLFGNFMKTLSLPYEPHRTPAYDRLLESLGLAKGESGAAPGPTSALLPDEGVRP
jgi:hypothetical protein